METVTSPPRTGESVKTWLVTLPYNQVNDFAQSPGSRGQVAVPARSGRREAHRESHAAVQRGRRHQVVEHLRQQTGNG